LEKGSNCACCGRKVSKCILFILKRLIESLFKNYTAVPAVLWKPDCDCISEYLKAAMGIYGGSLPIRCAGYQLERVRPKRT
jgi:hypothetical protein